MTVYQAIALLTGREMVGTKNRCLASSITKNLLTAVLWSQYRLHNNLLNLLGCGTLTWDSKPMFFHLFFGLKHGLLVYFSSFNKTNMAQIDNK